MNIEAAVGVANLWERPYTDAEGRERPARIALVWGGLGFRR